jgi:hypothetical protein
MTQLANALRAAGVIGVLCHYCGEKATQVRGATLYPFHYSLRDHIFWRCEACDAHVGCHQGTARPLGTLANNSVRRLRAQAHRHFDSLRKSKGRTRSEAYAWLAAKMELPLEACHMALMDYDMCAQVIDICRTETENMYAEI